MTQFNNKNLPQGLWIFIPELSMDTTEESLAAFLKETLGFEISADRIDLKTKVSLPPGSRPMKYAMVSFPDECFPSLMHRLIGHKLCDGRFITLKAAKRKWERELYRPNPIGAWPPPGIERR